MSVDIKWQRPDFPKFPKLATIHFSIPVTRVLTELGLKSAQRCYSKCSVSGLQNQTLQDDADCHNSHVNRLMMLSSEATPFSLYPHRIVGSRPRSIISLNVTNCNAMCFDLTANAAVNWNIVLMKWHGPRQLFPIKLLILFLCYDIQTASGNVHGFMFRSLPPWIRF